MLELDVDKRISATEALNHVWIQKNKSTAPLSEKALQNLTKFEVKNNKTLKYDKFFSPLTKSKQGFILL